MTITLTINNPIKTIKQKLADRKLPDEIVEYRVFDDGMIVKVTTFPKLRF